MNNFFPLVRSIESITKARLLTIILACAILALVMVILLVTAVTWISAELIQIEIGWIDTTINWLIALITGIGGWFILPVFTVLIAGMFEETVIHRVEFVYYPDGIRKGSPKFWPDIWHDIKFTIWALFLNIIILPLYFLGIGFIASIILNAYLLGREFFESAAGYHLGKPQANKLISQNRFVIFLGGLVITLLALIPVLNLFVPVFAIVWMVHVYNLKFRNIREI
jgi:CysZ protein